MTGRSVGSAPGQPPSRLQESEVGFRKAIIDLALTCGWKVYYSTDSRRAAKGWPDLVLGKLGVGVIFRELKRPGEYLRPDQHDWMHILTSDGLDFEVWRPDDWPEIVRTLTGAK